MALAQLGIGVDEFYELTPIEFTRAIEIVQKREQGQQEALFKMMMEAARFVAIHIWNASGRTLKRQQFDVKKLIPFSWDQEQQEIPKQSTKQMLSTMFSIAAAQNAHVRQKEKRKRKKLRFHDR